MADSGKTTNLSLAWTYQAQKVLPKVTVLIQIDYKKRQFVHMFTVFSGLPPGFKLTEEILNAEKPTLPPPPAIHYTEKHVRFIHSI